MKYYFPIHLDGGNRGCEAIAKGTAILLQEKRENLIGLCGNIELDRWLGVNQFVTLQKRKRKSIIFKVVNKFYKTAVHDDWKCKEFFYHYIYNSFLFQMREGDIMISTGGDMMCYDDNEVIYTVSYSYSHGIKAVLWGCSIGEENITPCKLNALKRFTMIYARETLTKAVLESHGLRNVVAYPDPAFVLEPEVCSLPSCFQQGNVIGLNISNFVIDGFELDTPFAKEIIKMVEYILAETKFHILLIPHVMWEGQDDRVISRKLKNYWGTDRISILDSEKLNYCQIRYVISKCNIFIGARTHAVISAYSTYVPAIALGYSVKSKGIANDVGMPEWSVIDSKNIEEGSLLDTFLRMEKEEQKIKDSLLKTMDSYKQNTSGLLDEVCKL